MLNVGVTTYLAGGLLFLMLTVLLVTSWRGRLRGALLATASGTTALWCLVLAWAALYQVVAPFRFLSAIEVLRDAAWLAFLLNLIGAAYGVQSIRRAAILVHATWITILVLVLWPGVGAVLPGGEMGFRVLALLALSLMALVLVEQLYRNTPQDQRWAIKYLCLGVGGMFAYDIVLYADALLFLQLDPQLWSARGAVNALVVPFIALAAARNPQWSLDVFVSRRFVFYGTTLIGAGLLMLALAVAGYYVRIYGGAWGTVAQVLILAVAALGLLTLLFSGQARARLRVFLSKHFYSYKYDYRDEWLRLIATLAEGAPGIALRQRVITALAQIVDGTTGMLWTRRDDGDFGCVAHWNQAPPLEQVPSTDPLVAFLSARPWVIDLRDVASRPDRYPGLTLPDWISKASGAWLIIPLRHHEQLVGFVLLGRGRAPREINWEDQDLLKTAGQQAAGYLALLDASEALSQARQFEAFNRLSAYVVHDLKNMVAQLDLVTSNARIHKHNPVFMEDAVATVANAAQRMNRLLGQLRKARFEVPAASPVRLDRCLEEVVANRSGRPPIPSLQLPPGPPIIVSADAERLGAVLEHLVQNAQEAVAEDGRVGLSLDREGDWACICIEDDGVGMDPGFIRERLFRPFDTTKGNAGMGIGVYEAREFVLTLHGKMQVESAPGRGTRFSIRLPLVSSSPMGIDPDPFLEVKS